MPSNDEYHLFHSDVLKRLSERDWFVPCLADFYARVADAWGCSITTSDRRFIDAYNLWKIDSARTLSDGIDGGTASLDHFKEASFLAFWLRRMVPINDIYRNGPRDVDQQPTDTQQHFFQYGSELCALLVGFYICLNYEAQNSRVAVQDVQLREKFVYENPMLLKHKNISAHGLYMMYHALFGNLMKAG